MYVPAQCGITDSVEPFSQEEVKKLAQCYKLDWEDGEAVNQPSNMVGEHIGTYCPLSS